MHQMFFTIGKNLDCKKGRKKLFDVDEVNSFIFEARIRRQSHTVV